MGESSPRMHLTIGPFRFPLVTASALLLGALSALLPAGAARAEVTFTNLYFFGADPTAGGQPTGNLIRGADGDFYGTTNSAIFRVTPAGEVTFLHRFPIDGFLDLIYPNSPLVQTADGSLYGTTGRGGNVQPGGLGGGTIFRLAPDGTFTTLHAFSGSDGLNPDAGLILGADGNFYGTAGGDGANSKGTIFRVTPDGTFTVLRSAGSGGADVSGYGQMVRAPDGSFYGAAGGVNGAGIVYRLAPDGTFTTLHTFTGAEGTDPGVGLTIGADGNLYGATSNGGAFKDGTVFRLTPGGVLTTLHDFNGADGARPTTLIADGNGEFYGTTAVGGPSLGYFGSNHGVVFKIGADGTFFTLHDFTGLDDNGPGGLVVDRDGTLYGTTTGEDPDGSPFISTGSFYKVVTDRAPVPPVLNTAMTSDDLNGDASREVDILLTLSSTQNKPVKIHYTVAGSARPGIDYQPLSGVVKFKKFQNAQLIRVQELPGDQNTVDAPVVKIKFEHGGGYTLSGSRTLKVPLPQ